MLKIYLAGPDVFLPDAERVGEQKKSICRKYGFEGLFPLDKDQKIGTAAPSIFQANCSLMRRADVGLFNLTPFRGPSADAGTVFELGFLFASNKPVYGYTRDTAAYRERVVGAGDPVAGQNRDPRDRDGYAVENFGLADNLMIVRAIEDSGGVIAAVAEDADTSIGVPLAAFKAFEACLRMMKARI